MIHGWTNYETWVTNLWLENEEWAYKTVLSLRKGAKNKWEYADRIREFTENLLENDLEGLAADLFSHAVSQINWDEIAENYFPEEEEEE